MHACLLQSIYCTILEKFKRRACGAPRFCVNDKSKNVSAAVCREFFHKNFGLKTKKENNKKKEKIDFRFQQVVSRIDGR